MDGAAEGVVGGMSEMLRNVSNRVIVKICQLVCSKDEVVMISCKAAYSLSRSS